VAPLLENHPLGVVPPAAAEQATAVHTEGRLVAGSSSSSWEVRQFVSNIYRARNCKRKIDARVFMVLQTPLLEMSCWLFTFSIPNGVQLVIKKIVFSWTKFRP